MRIYDFIKTHKTIVRIVYWVTFVIFMIIIVLPLFVFFYLFDENRTKQMIIDQFDYQKYKVEVAGRVIPKLWHGLSLELGSVTINAADNKNLIELNNVSCQLSWLDLLIGKYKVKRFTVNGVDVYEENVINDGLSNLLNVSNNHSDAFSNIKIVDIYNIKTVGKTVRYPISNGSLEFERGASSAKFKAGLQLFETKTFITAEGDLVDVSGDILHFADFRVKSYDKQAVINTVATASYDIKAQKLIMNDLTGKITLNGYAGGINISQVGLSSLGADISQFNGYLDANNDFVTQHLSATTDKISLKNFKQLLIGQLNLQYVITIDNSKFTLDSVAKDFVMDVDTPQIRSNSCINNIKYTSPRFAGKNGLQAVLSGVCNYSWQTMQAQLDLSGTFNNAPAKLGLKISNQREKPYIEADGTIGSLDFSRLKLQSEKILPLYNDNSSLPFAWLSLFDMDANLNIKNFALDRISLGNLITKLNIANSQLNIYKISADVYGGSLSGSAKITKLNANAGMDIKNNYNVSIQQSLYNLDLQNMLEDLFNVKAISGIANSKVDINANNIQSYEDLHKKLNGQIVIDAKKGAFQGVDFNLFANPSIGIPTAPKSTIFEHLAAKFDFVDGVSRYGNLTFSSPYVIANGSGIINFVDTTINYKLNIKSVLPQNDQKLSSVVIPVVVSGNLFSPKINIQNMHLSNKTINNLNKNKVSSLYAKAKPKEAKNNLTKPSTHHKKKHHE